MFTAQPIASPGQKSLLVVVGFCARWHGLVYVSRTEHNNYEKNKARGQVCLTFCVSTDKIFSKVACSIFPFQLPLLQCQLLHSGPTKRCFVCAGKTCSPMDMLGTKRLHLHTVTWLEEENVVRTARPTAATERCSNRDVLFTDQNTDRTNSHSLRHSSFQSPQLTSLYRENT